MVSGVSYWMIRPASNTATLSPIASASVSLPVTCRKVTSSRSRIARSSICMRSRRLASSAPSGSSSSTSLGCITSERASATRCFWPPEICSGLRSSRPARPTISMDVLTRSVNSAFDSVCAPFRKPKATFSKTVRCGNKAKFWNTNPMPRSCAGKSVISRPWNHMRPASGVSKPAITRNKLVLPEPDGPSRAI